MTYSTPIFGTIPTLGVDLSTSGYDQPYSATASNPNNPEYPQQPFQIGTVITMSNGGEAIYAQTATATSINKVAITAPAASATLTLAEGKTLAANNILTLAGTDSTTITFQGTDTYVGRATTDTVVSWSLEIIRALIRYPAGLSLADMTRELQVAIETIRPHLDTLCQIVYPYAKKGHGPIISIVDQPVGDAGLKTRRVYQLDPRIVEFWRTAELPFNLISSKRKATRGPKPGATYKSRTKKSCG